MGQTHVPNDDGSNRSTGLPEALSAMLPVVDAQGAPVVKVGLLLTLYFKNAHLDRTRRAVAECVENALHRWGQRMRWGLLGAGKPRGVERFAAHATGAYLNTVDTGSPDGWQVYWHSDAPNHASDFGLQAFGPCQHDCEQLGHLAYLTAHFPLVGPSCGPEALLALCREWSMQLQPVHGYGGLGIVHPADRSAAIRCEADEHALATRFASLEVDYPLKHALWTREGIKGGNWLTVVSDRWASALKTADGQLALCPAMNAIRYDGGLIIRTGEAPIVIDGIGGEGTALYRQLARLLKPITVGTHPAVHTSRGGFCRPSFEAWLGRFAALERR